MQIIIIFAESATFVGQLREREIAELCTLQYHFQGLLKRKKLYNQNILKEG